MKTEWDLESAIATYNVEGWGNGYFTVNSSGNVEAKQLQENGGSIDLLEVVNEARARHLGAYLQAQIRSGAEREMAERYRTTEAVLRETAISPSEIEGLH